MCIKLYILGFFTDIPENREGWEAKNSKKIWGSEAQTREFIAKKLAIQTRVEGCEWLPGYVWYAWQARSGNVPPFKNLRKTMYESKSVWRSGFPGAPNKYPVRRRWRRYLTPLQNRLQKGLEHKGVVIFFFSLAVPEKHNTAWNKNKRWFHD